MSRWSRRSALALGGGLIGCAGEGPSSDRLDRVPASTGRAARLHVLRPTPFLAGEQRLFDANTRRFTERTGVEVRVDYQPWEDLRPKASAAAEASSGPDIVLGWLDDPHTAPEKVLDLSTLAAEIGARHGGWWEAAEGCGRRADGTWISLPIAVSGNSVYCRRSWVQEAGFERVPSDPAGFLELCRALKRNGHPPGFALGNAVVDGNSWTHSVLWAFGSAVVDQRNQVIIDNPRTVEALEFARELHATFLRAMAEAG